MSWGCRVGVGCLWVQDPEAPLLPSQRVESRLCSQRGQCHGCWVSSGLFLCSWLIMGSWMRRVCGRAAQRDMGSLHGVAVRCSQSRGVCAPQSRAVPVPGGLAVGSFSREGPGGGAGGCGTFQAGRTQPEHCQGGSWPGPGSRQLLGATAVLRALAQFLLLILPPVPAPGGTLE